jgi:hypothetical protein
MDSNPEDLIEQAYSRLRMPMFQHGDLLALRETLGEEARGSPQEANQHFEGLNIEAAKMSLTS